MTDLENDVRLLRRRVAKGFVSRASVHELLKPLADVEGQAEWVEVTLEPGEGESRAADQVAEADAGEGGDVD